MTRVVRIIGRLNIGGPAIQAITLTDALIEHGYETTLVRGAEGPSEGSMDALARELDVSPVLVRNLRRDPGALDDIRALLTLVRILRRDRPAIVHTHAAKAGTLGRLAVLLAFGPWRRPKVVHTYHGHSLSGYFSPKVSAIYTRIEQLLAHVSDRLVAVSPEVRDELIAFGVGDARKFTVVTLGFDLSPFAVPMDQRRRRGEALRAELGLPIEGAVVTLVARLVPIKRVDRFLDAAARVAAFMPTVNFLVVGDGELRTALESHVAAQALGERLTWAGFRDDIPDVLFASDVVVLTSDNEGTPVSLIEAQAAGTPVVCTRVGGAATVIRDGESGIICDLTAEAVAVAIASILVDAERAAVMGAVGRKHSVECFSLNRLISQITELYTALIS